MPSSSAMACICSTSWRTGTASLAQPVRDTLAHAVRARRIVRIAYVDQAGERTRRDVEAHGLVTAPYREYLVGWCRLRQGPRLFRLDRIGAAWSWCRPKRGAEHFSEKRPLRANETSSERMQWTIYGEWLVHFYP